MSPRTGLVCKFWRPRRCWPRRLPAWRPPAPRRLKCPRRIATCCQQWRCGFPEPSPSRIMARCKPRCCRLKPRTGTEFAELRRAARRCWPAGRMQVRNLYLLDASMQTAPADTQFFCADKSGALNVTITMRALPPGKYARGAGRCDRRAAGRATGYDSGLGRGCAVRGWKLAGLPRTRESSMGTTACGTGRGRGRWRTAIPGARGTATKRRAICCFRSIFSPRRIWTS